MYINDKKQLGGCNQNNILCKYLIGYFKTKPYDVKCSIGNETCRGECCFYKKNKDEMLNKLMNNLKSKSDEELIKDYEDAGIKIVDYKPGTQGKVVFKKNIVNDILPFGEFERNDELKQYSEGEIQPLIEEDKEMNRRTLDYFDKVNKAFDDLSDEEFEQLMIKAGIENCPYEDDTEGIKAYYRKILKSNGFSEEDIKEYLKTINN
jgi:hypothetical protein